MNKQNKQQHNAKRRKKQPSDRVTSRYNRLPNEFNVTLSYDVRSQHSSSAYSVYNFDMLDIFTIQPYYRDQLFAIWQKAVVIGVTVDTRLVNTSTTVDTEVLTYYGSGTTVQGLSFSQALEFPTTKRFMLSTSGNGKTRTIRQHVAIKSLAKAPNFWQDSDFWQSSSAKPAYCVSQDGYQYATGIFSANGSSVATVTMDRRISFHVRFFNLSNVANSLFSPIASEKPVLVPATRPKLRTTKKKCVEIDPESSSD